MRNKPWYQMKFYFIANNKNPLFNYDHYVYCFY